ncbi:hypothetical protein DPMN_160986 [Dreissena polymorpha]|uniref:Uncharacterized protein n=1 Tax=Dreissena polymorpha TaxID=45954 RepID=A0A9D4EPJ8_DREPO|nr:hypothetical protein DPMN_160986 [Dreissena polymorpha]
MRRLEMLFNSDIRSQLESSPNMKNAEKTKRLPSRPRPVISIDEVSKVEQARLLNTCLEDIISTSVLMADNRPQSDLKTISTKNNNAKCSPVLGMWYPFANGG